jgi:hypothetical protein
MNFRIDASGPSVAGSFVSNFNVADYCPAPGREAGLYPQLGTK